jgi:hypothetical protein
MSFDRPAGTQRSNQRKGHESAAASAWQVQDLECSSFYKGAGQLTRNSRERHPLSRCELPLYAGIRHAAFSRRRTSLNGGVAD